MENYGQILLIAMPIFLVLILTEKFYGIFKKQDYVPIIDSVSSISAGMANVTKSVLGLSVIIVSYEWMETHFALFNLEASVLAYVIGFICIDFYGYWAHRLSHRINLLWNRHVIHHSSEEFNLACALRQSISDVFAMFTFLLMPAAVLGVPTVVIAITLPIHLFLQFWYHTRYIGKLGFLEHILVTPSHHRVHHAVNKEYMDKNLSQIFIVWDKIFGTFKAELPDVPPVYGISRPARTWNPFKISIQHFWLLVKDAWRAEKWGDKFKIWFMPTGWRPEGMDEKYPVSKIENVYNYEKYNTQNSSSLVAWSSMQMLVTLLLMSYFFGNLANIGAPNIYLYGLFIFVSIFSYTDLMDKNPMSWVFETLRFALGIALLYTMNGWFKMDEFMPYASPIVLIYLTISWLMSFYFTQFGFKNENLSQAVSRN